MSKKNNKSLIKTSVEECLKVNINKVHVILGHNKELREKELESCNVNICFFDGYEEGIGASIGFGMQCIEPDVDAVIVSLADMPKIKYTSYKLEIFEYQLSNKI